MATGVALFSALAFAGCGSDDESSTTTTATDSAAAATTTDGGASSGASKAPGGTVKVGNIASIAGIGGAFDAFSAGVKAYFEYSNANGGIDGTKVDFVTVDDGGDPGKAAAGARKLVQQDDVLAIVGMASLADAAVAKFLNQQGIPVLGGWPTSPAWQLPNDNMFSSLQGPNPPLCPTWSNELAKAEGIKSIGYIAADFPVAMGDADCRQAAGKYFGLKTDTRINISPTQADLRPAVRRAMDANVDAIYMVAGLDQAIKGVQAGEQLGYKGSYIVTQPGGAAKALKSIAKQLDGRLLTSAFSLLPGDPEGENEELDAFRKGMAEYAPDYQTEITAVSGWAAGRFFADALRAGGDDKEAIIAWAKGQKEYDFAGLQGPVDFTIGSTPNPCVAGLVFDGSDFARAANDKADGNFGCEPLLDTKGNVKAYEQYADQAN